MGSSGLREFRVSGLGFGIWGLGFRVRSLGFGVRVWVLGFGCRSDFKLSAKACSLWLGAFLHIVVEAGVLAQTSAL